MLARIEQFIFSLLILLLPTQFGKHFWPDFAYVDGIRVDYLSPTLYVTDILIFILAGIFLIRILARFVQISFQWRPIAFYIFFLSIIVLSILFSHSPANGVFPLFKFLECSLLTFYVSQTIRSQQSLLRLIYLLGIGVLFESLLATAQYWQQQSVGGLLYLLGERTISPSAIGAANASLNGSLVLRPYGTFSHPNVLAGFLLCGLLFSWFATPFTKQVKKLFLTTVLLIGTVGLFFTLGRTPISLWLFFLFTFFLVNNVVQRKQLVKRFSMEKLYKNSGLMIAGIVALVALFCLTMFSPRFLQFTLHEESVVDRLLLNQSAVQMTIAHPFIGVGLGNFLPSLNDVQSPQTGRYFLQPVHNILLFIAAEIGLIGLSLALWFIGKTYIHVLQGVKKNKSRSVSLLYLSPLICLTAIVLLGMVDHYFLTLQQGQLLLAIIIGLCWTDLT